MCNIGLEIFVFMLSHGIIVIIHNYQYNWYIAQKQAIKSDQNFNKLTENSFNTSTTVGTITACPNSISNTNEYTYAEYIKE